MSRVLRILVAVIVLFNGAVSSMAAENAPLARGTAITDPDLLRKLDQSDALSISHLLQPERNANVPLTSDLLFAFEQGELFRGDEPVVRELCDAPVDVRRTERPVDPFRVGGRCRVVHQPRLCVRMAQKLG